MARLQKIIWFFISINILCANENCAGSDENLDNGFFNYIGGIGWVGPNINLKPGMGIKLKTTNAGWFRWTLPEES